jgi:hypothetical protein
MEILALNSLPIVKRNFEIPEIPRIKMMESSVEENNLFPLKPRKRQKGLIVFTGYSWKGVEYDMDDQGMNCSIFIFTR